VGALASASTTAKDANARAVAALASVSTTAEEADARAVAALASASTTGKEAHARALAALASANTTVQETHARAVSDGSSICHLMRIKYRCKDCAAKAASALLTFDMMSRADATMVGCKHTVRLRGIGTGISEASKRVPIFSFVTQGGKQVSSYVGQTQTRTRSKFMPSV
jgi:hypothetical protein